MNITINLCSGQTNFKTLAINIVPLPPRIETMINWEKMSFLNIQEILILINNKINNKIKNTKLLINTIENNSNHTLDVIQSTNNLINLLNRLNTHCIILTSNIPYQIYENLRLSNKNLTSRSTAIKLARYINAEYILCSTIYNQLKLIKLDMELISVKNGEILWSKTIPI